MPSATGWHGYSFLYLFVALSPFIIVSSIVMISIFMYDFKGFFFLLGLIFTMVINTLFIGNRIPDYYATLPKDPACNASFMNFVDTTITSLPKGTIINAYTLGYFSYCINKASTHTSNGTMIAFFVLLILGDIAFNLSNHCVGWVNLLIAIAYGILFGVMCAAIVGAASISQLYFLSGTGRESCDATNKKFRCTVTQNGQML
jgi:hypothetical protein